jgi:hypothetical protein
MVAKPKRRQGYRSLAAMIGATVPGPPVSWKVKSFSTIQPGFQVLAGFRSLLKLSNLPNPYAGKKYHAGEGNSPGNQQTLDPLDREYLYPSECSFIVTILCRANFHFSKRPSPVSPVWKVHLNGKIFWTRPWSEKCMTTQDASIGFGSVM